MVWTYLKLNKQAVKYRHRSLRLDNYETGKLTTVYLNNKQSVKRFYWTVTFAQ